MENKCRQLLLRRKQRCTYLQFRYDECGSALDHSNDLSQIVQDVKSWRLNDQVNMVSHSKGGLDARVYLDKSGTHDVANLIMIGTPNGGNPLANEVVAAAKQQIFSFQALICLLIPHVDLH